MLNIIAPAKINIVLEVLGKRDDGYHEVCSIMQTVSLYDSMSFELADEVLFQGSELNIQNNDNLVIKAADFLQKVCGCNKGARIELNKCIPYSAGLGGGSSDAAVTLLALNELWGLQLSNSELFDVAAEIGSDVPFFLQQGTALVEGRGEKVKPILQLASYWFVLFIPPVTCPIEKTKTLFSKLGSENFTDGSHVRNVLQSLSDDGDLLHASLYNVFDGVAFDAFPGLEKYWEMLIQAGAEDVHLAGSGPGLFVLASSESRAKEWSKTLQVQGLETYVVSTFESQVV